MDSTASGLRSRGGVVKTGVPESGRRGVHEVRSESKRGLLCPHLLRGTSRFNSSSQFCTTFM